jgi:hypothetical protein
MTREVEVGGPGRSGCAGPAAAAHPDVIAALLRPEAYAHPVREPRLVETHISWVLLTGDWAYKIKKPVKLEFLDFSTLALRKHYCEEELRLNRRLSSGLYDGVVAIGGDPRAPRVGVEPALEYAVRMRQFRRDAEADRRLAAGRLGLSELRALGAGIGRFHLGAATAGSDSAYGEPEEVWRSAAENFAEVGRHVRADTERRALARLARWSEERFRALRGSFARRKSEGWIREGHGDLHLTNLVQRDEGLTAFDCLEFDPRLRWIDVVCDVAFLVMDLELRGRDDLAYGFLDAYLEATGDYGGAEVLDFYRVYRSLVRAKVAALRAAQVAEPEGARERARCRAHLRLALRYVQPRRPRLLLMHGYSGSGKSWLGERLAVLLPALRVRSDVQRKRLAGLDALAASHSGVAAGLYAPGQSRRTYAQLERIVREVLRSGESVVVDAAFLQRDQRAAFLRLARELRVPCAIVDCVAEPSVLEARIRRRAGDASEADTAVLAYQQRVAEPLAPGEPVVTVSTGTEPALRPLVRRLRQMA